MVDDKVPANPHPADEFEDMYSIEVISVWLCIWILAVGLSRYARHRSNKHGETAWARWALMPAYERVLMLKKLCIVAMAVDWLCQHYWPPAHSTARWSASNAARYLAHTLYVWTYSVVVVALCAHSGGSKTLWRAMCTMLVGTVITATLMWFEWGYYWNAPDGPHMVSWGPSWMTTALPFNNFFRWTTEGWPVLAWLLLLVLCLVYPIGIALHLADVWHPRQGALSVAMLTLVAATILALMFAWPVKQQLGWWPLLLYGVIEAPFKYYIMLLDSRWWSELSLDADISIDALDSNLSTPLLCEISSCLQETRVEPFQRPPHIHWTRVVLGRPFAAGAEGTVYDAELDGSSRIAVKVMYCDELDMHNVGKICREIEISWSLAVGCAQIVRLHGFTIQPPRAMVVMQLCGKGTLLELLQDVSLPYVTRLGLGEDIASAVTHMHSLGYLHRDIKSLNCFVTDEMEARLGDFGETITATEADALPEPVVTGTAEWMAPEILCHLYPESNAIQRYAGLGYTAGSDCFSLGVVLWECVTSKVPYDSLHNIERLSQDALLQRILSGLRVDEGEQIGDGQGGIVHEPLGDLLRAAWGDTPELRPDAAALSEGLRNEINRVLETKRDASQCLDAIGRGSPGSHPNGWMHMLLDDLDSGIQLVET